LLLYTDPPQAVSRVWRYGQQKPCFIYHLMYAGTFETRVFERVLVKEELFQRVSLRAGQHTVTAASLDEQ
jgi:SNF2 family DNA or RNA helicase